jgi:hypothetical protein
VKQQAPTMSEDQRLHQLVEKGVALAITLRTALERELTIDEQRHAHRLVDDYTTFATNLLNAEANK